jgi:hypothetical protein
MQKKAQHKNQLPSSKAFCMGTGTLGNKKNAGNSMGSNKYMDKQCSFSSHHSVYHKQKFITE